MNNNNTAKNIEKTNKMVVNCGNNEDHPLVYLNINKDTNEIICPYCSKKFIFEQ